MSALERQVIQSLDGLSEDNLKFLLDMIERFMKPMTVVKPQPSTLHGKRVIGIYKPDEVYAPDYDIDEDNEIIAKMFGEVDE